jgi:serine/threonine-protein kinase
VQTISPASAAGLPGDNLEVKEAVDDTLDMRFPVGMPQDPNVGATICDRYLILEVVGRGGMGVVYKAEQHPIERIVAVKMLHPHIIADAETIKRFHKEAQAVSRIEHAHSVRIYDFGITGQAQPFIVMDFVDGGSLRDLLRKEANLPLKRAEEIFLQVVDALSCAHEAGIIHRDMKPENIMLCEKSGKPDFVYVVDFGISTLDTGKAAYNMVAQSAAETRGSPAYMSPEQCVRGAEIDHRTDIYSLAISIYESLSGRLPYAARNAFELLDAHKNSAPLPLTSAHQSLGPCQSLSAVLLRALEKNPEKRQQSMQEFGMELAGAFRKDSIRQGYLKNRVDTLSTPSPVEAFVAPASSPSDDSRDEQTASGTRIRFADPVESGVRMMKSMIQSMTQPEDEFDEEPQPSSDSGRYQFSHCPRCNERVAPGILFCLACGRSLATTHEFAKIRAAQGVFTLPRAQDSYSGLPTASRRRRALRRNLAMTIVKQWLIPLTVGFCLFAAVYALTEKFPSDFSQWLHKH